MVGSARTLISAPLGTWRRRAGGALFGAALAGAVLAPGTARAGVPTTLYDFCAQPDCADGSEPEAALIQDKAGNLYGTTVLGGKYNSGTVFALSHNRGRPAWTENVLYSFCVSGCGEGAGPPWGSLVMSPSGAIYGATALGGGLNKQGSVFELTFDNSTNEWTEKTLYNFCSANLCSDGRWANGSLILSPTGTIFGTTLFGGNEDHGTVFALIPNQAGSWTHVVLYAFCQIKRRNICIDGSNPGGGLALDDEGRLYGTTQSGGRRHSGTVFELAPHSATVYTETVLHDFCRRPGCTDGAAPAGGLVMSANQQRFFGTTSDGGPLSTDAGVVFQLTRKTTAPWPTRVIYSFCSLGRCADGFSPYSIPHLLFRAGHLFGATVYGGTRTSGGNGYGGGTVFELAADGPPPWRETVLYSFCQAGGIACSDGQQPMAGLTAAGASKFHGATRLGGLHGGGTVFEIIP
jgi:uncharacterized repeat protein (TIGR03803 family)